MPTVQERAEALSDRIFVGGPVDDFEEVGRLQLVTLLREGLQPSSSVLDIGCGCLRGGYWMIHFLDPGCYYGIEPAREMLEAGLEGILEPGLADAKRPQFAHNDDWDFTVFRVEFDFVVARSIWTHASKAQIVNMLDSFRASAAPGATLLASYLPAGWRLPWSGRRLRGPMASDYKGDQWVGRSHEQDKPGLVHHSRRWIQEACEARGLTARELPHGLFNEQRWLRVDSA
jgi:SAM-dependent methyltransferase